MAFTGIPTHLRVVNVPNGGVELGAGLGTGLGVGLGVELGRVLGMSSSKMSAVFSTVASTRWVCREHVGSMRSKNALVVA